MFTSDSLIFFRKQEAVLAGTENIWGRFEFKKNRDF